MLLGFLKCSGKCVKATKVKIKKNPIYYIITTFSVHVDKRVKNNLKKGYKLREDQPDIYHLYI